MSPAPGRVFIVGPSHTFAALAEAELDVAGLVERAADAAVVEDFRFPDDKIVRLAEEELTGDLT